MMAVFNFPNSPALNDIYTENGVSFKWTGLIWERVNTSQGAQGAQGFQGVQGAQGNQGFQGVQGAQGNKVSKEFKAHKETKVFKALRIIYQFPLIHQDLLMRVTCGGIVMMLY